MTGTLGLFSLADLFQLLSGAGRSGRLSVDHPLGHARVYFERGEVRHAEFGQLEGDEAVYALFQDERGAFEFRSGLPAPRVSVRKGTQNLVLEAVRRLDEARRDTGEEATEIETDLVPEHADRGEAPHALTLGAPEQAVMEAVDGRRSLARIADRAGQTQDETARIVARLVAAGVLLARKRRPRTARLVVRPTPEALLHDTAVADVGIVEAWRRAMGRMPQHLLAKRESGVVDRFRLQAREDVGPYLLLAHAVLLRTGLKVDQPLLVRPLEEEA
ncbi:MAG: DUF4388 domain-containing protein [Trueperaceae bacterium]|nr:DUF4388 domain-containing protein [Trueperaceae bacterium]